MKSSKNEIAIISDVHGNLEALQAVLADIAVKGIKSIYCLGDIVGYGPNPNECCALIRESCQYIVAGNHDWTACGKISSYEMNPYAAAAVEWTIKTLTGENISFLNGLPLRIDDGVSTYCHGSPLRPDDFNYIEYQWDINASSGSFEKLCFIGHTHKAIVFRLKGGLYLNAVYAPYNTKINNAYQHIVNVGSVGQPRDGNPMACYTIASASGVRTVN